MKIILLNLLFIFTTTVSAQILKISPLELCAKPDDSIIEGEKIDFALYADSEFLDSTYSKTAEVTPGYCKKQNVLHQYELNVALSDIGEPLRVHVAKVGRWLNFLSKRNIYLGTKRQLRLVDCEDKYVQCLDVNNLNSQGQTLEIETKYATVKLLLSL
jgi:hypothetical protein